MNEFQIVEANLRTAMRFFGEATGSGDIQQLEGALGIYSGIGYGVFNIGLLERNGTSPGLERCVEACEQYFATRSPRWSFWLCEDLLERHERRRMRHPFENRGMRLISNPPMRQAATPPRKIDRNMSFSIRTVRANNAATAGISSV